MKRIFSLMIALLLLIPTASADVTELPTLTISLSASATKVGDTVRVIAAVKNAPVCASYHIIYSYDTNVLKPIEGKNLNSGGIFMTNINPKDKGTINTVAADSNKVIEGDVQLFYTDFSVIAAPTSGANTPLTFTYLEFYTPELEKLINIRSEPCSIPIIGTNTPQKPETETPEETTPSTPTPTPDPQPETDTPVTETPDPETKPVTPENSTSTGTTDETNKQDTPQSTPTPTLPEDSEGNDPTGDWQFHEEKNEITHSNPNGEDKTYTYEPIIDSETNTETGVILYDEDGNEVGKLKVEKDEDGNLQVLKEFWEDTEDPSPLFFIIPIAIAALAGGGLIAFFLIKQNKAKKATEDHE